MLQRRLFAAMAAVTLTTGATALILSNGAQAAVACRVDYAITNQWQDGFGAGVTITNLGDPVSGWTLAWSFPAGQVITQLWNGLHNTYTATGSGVHAYIIDTGVDPTHANFGGRATFDFNSIDSNNTDCNSHGTHVAGTIGSASYGVAKGVRLHGVKWLNCSGSGTTSAAISAVNWVTANKIAPAVANTSWNATYSATLATALTNMMNSGVFLATSGGNTGGNSCDRLPRNLTAALVVAATTSTDARASYSSIGPCIDIYGPGSSIISTVPGGGSGSKSGTSMSTPHAAGVAALYKQTFGNASQATIHAWIINNASNGVVTGSLSGTPNRLLNKRSL